MTNYFDKNLQIINNLDIQLNIFKTKELKISVLKKFVNDFSKINGISYNSDDIDAICEALEFMDVVIEYDSASDESSPASAPVDESSTTDETACSEGVFCDKEPAHAPEPKVSDGAVSEFKIEGSGISYSDIEIKLNELLHPAKPDFSELACAGSSADLCRMILDNPDNYIKVMYAIRKQL